MEAWKPEYVLNLENIDAQHQKYFEMSSNLTEALNQARETSIDAPKLIRLASGFRLYAFYHFHTEEGFMIDIRYPEYFAHRDLHNDYIAKINASLSQLEEIYHKLNAGTAQPDNFFDAIEEMRTFAIRWIGEHIINEDAKYAAFSRKQGGAAA